MNRRWSLWDEMRRMQDEMDNMFRAFLSNEPWGRVGLLEGPSSAIAASDFRQPLSDFWEDENEIKVDMEIPGVEKQDIVINAKEGGLEVKVQKKDEYKEEDKKRGFYRLERKYAGFYRYFSLPENADTKGIDATYKNGILKLRIPKKKISETNLKRIEVK